VVLSRLGAASPYLHKYRLPAIEIGDAYLDIYVLRGAGEFASVTTFSLELLTFVRFRPGWEPPHPIFTSTSSPSLQLAMHICIYMYYEGKVSLGQ